MCFRHIMRCVFIPKYHTTKVVIFHWQRKASFMNYETNLLMKMLSIEPDNILVTEAELLIWIMMIKWVKELAGSKYWRRTYTITKDLHRHLRIPFFKRIFSRNSLVSTEGIVRDSLNKLNAIYMSFSYALNTYPQFAALKLDKKMCVDSDHLRLFNTKGLMFMRYFH